MKENPSPSPSISISISQSKTATADIGESFLANPFDSMAVEPEPYAPHQLGIFQRLRSLLQPAAPLASDPKQQSPPSPLPLPAEMETDSGSSASDDEMQHSEGDTEMEGNTEMETSRFRHHHPQSAHLDEETRAIKHRSDGGDNVIWFGDDEHEDGPEGWLESEREDDTPVKPEATRRAIRSAADAEQVIRELTTVQETPVWAGASQDPPVDGVRRERGRYVGDSLARILQQEIQDFIAFITPMPEEHKMRLFCLRRISDVVHTIWPEAAVKVFGSFETKLYLPSSDLDVVVFCPEPNTKTTLNKLASKIKKANLVHGSSLQVIPARIPIIKFVENVSFFSVDISLNLDNGLRAANTMKSLLIKHASLRPLVILLKQFLAMRGINEVFSGGLGSYGLSLMVANFLEVHPLLQSGRILQQDNVGVLLMDFLDLYGKRFNYDTVGISLETSRLYFSKPFAKAGALSALDPTDPENDVTRGSFNMHTVRKAFSNAMDVLEGTFFECCQRSAQEQHVFRVRSILGTIIRIPNDVVESRRAVVEQYLLENDGIDEAVRFMEGAADITGYIHAPDKPTATGTATGRKRKEEKKANARKKSNKKKKKKVKNNNNT